MEVLTKQQTIDLIKSYSVPPLLNRRQAAEFVGMKLPAFDKFVSRNPQLKRKAPGSTPRYCPKELRNIFKNGY